MNDIKSRTHAAPLKAEIITNDEVYETFIEHPVAEPWFPLTNGAEADERRASPRYLAVKGRSWLSWHDGRQYKQTAAWILNISVGGCLVATEELVPGDRALWMRLDDRDVGDWAEVRVTEYVPGNGTIAGVRLVFSLACPYELMKAVAFPTDNKLSRAAPSSSWNANSW